LVVRLEPVKGIEQLRRSVGVHRVPALATGDREDGSRSRSFKRRIDHSGSLGRVSEVRDRSSREDLCTME
ncbi:MAG TPA: hypothetical protein VNO51_24130, partial [Ilumatobacteraceae bacterium]|nr:hypothetical protein [Ilumatobacteraceae bacterium]